MPADKAGAYMTHTVVYPHGSNCLETWGTKAAIKALMVRQDATGIGNGGLNQSCASLGYPVPENGGGD